MSQVVEDHFRPEMRRMERALLLQILDTAWKEHLLAMDHLRSSVGLRGYAQVDPKVEYKREGMRLFEHDVGLASANYVTDLIFRMEQLDEGFVGSTWVEARRSTKKPRRPAKSPSQQQAAIAGTEADKKLEPIRNREPKASAATTPAPAAAARNSRTAACGSAGVA